MPVIETQTNLTAQQKQAIDMAVDEQSPKLWDARRWRYTAITRAAKELRYYFKG